MAYRRPSTAINKRRRVVVSLYTTLEMVTTLDAPAFIDAKAICWSKIAIFPQLGDPRRNIAITFGMEKLKWCGYLMVKIF